MKDFRTPLNKSIGLGSAKHGTDHFWRQRLTAFANVPLFIFFIILLIMLVGKDYATVISYLSNPIIAVVMAVMVIAGIYHMKLGMQVIIEDYFPNHYLRVFILSLNIFFCFIMGAACLFALVKIALGG
ncbi:MULTISPECIES: succinate dehydrogenase, hydrophobic membrane anchor protein [unclassified Bartonella]|uniref:succinate dehydrogenase, hydrophobic membrane anchor protein n=1 Tax=unclassified Bartonella TaxID=2645622 RepID=UPI0015FE7AAF|nr:MULTISPECIES: succinate dehydrogenase, hydrophobic membrane anchor protein [unclassified Bartonella]UXN03169.1 succinate dehydrogenase, hydrophobic membrane anchor protein [Bartonella sp. HY406]UXN06133.1 succinate dehydrogenase, hydrophobic membrane anchor protein [Bartonella sp. HY761]